jgi:hypothetical protein
MNVRARVGGGVFCVLIATAILSAEQSDSTFRVFLRSGDALPSHGEPAEVGDRLVFTLLMGEPIQGRRRLQLVDLPATAIDLDRTRRYANAVRADFYARSLGEIEYQAVTTDVARTLDQLATVDDPPLRLALAVQARARLAGWSRRSYGYRAADVETLFGLFDQVIAELRAAVGQGNFSFDLTSGPTPPAIEPLRAAPGLRESIRLALAAVTAADDGPSRMAILRGAMALVPEGADFDELRRNLVRRRDVEAATDHAYAALRDELLARAARFLEEGEVEAIEGLRRELPARDAALGAARPKALARLRAELDAMVGRATAYRAALDHYELVKADLLAFERRVRPVLNTLDGLTPALEAIRDESGPQYERLLAVEARIAEIAEELARAAPPDDVVDVHATLASAVEMARQASARRRLAAVTANGSLARQASAAAAGALLLARQARETLLDRLFPPARH